MKPNLSFKFYSILGNEDAEPYLDDNLIAVADGLGGSGAFKISLDDSLYKNNQIFEYLYEIVIQHKLGKESDLFKNYLNEWFQNLASLPYKTSALWGSRIVIASFVYAIKNCSDFSDLRDSKTRQKLSQFISDNLKKTVEYFKIDSPKMKGLSLLPTTLASIMYKDSSKDSIEVDVLWVGDSRCYVLSKDGLKQLTIDDEENRKITNIFELSDKQAVINHQAYSLPQPCILLAVSDGAFDPFYPIDNFKFEALLLKYINSCNSPKELSDTLKNFYDNNGNKPDDTTMCFVPIGFETYDDIKKGLEQRSKYVLNINEIYDKYKPVYDLFVVPDSIDKIRSYILERTISKLDYFIDQIIAVYDNKTHDKILTKDISDIIESYVKTITIDKESGRKQLQRENLRVFCEYLKTTDKNIKNSVFAKDIDSTLYKKCIEMKCLDNPNMRIVKEISKKFAESISKVMEESSSYQQSVAILKLRQDEFEKLKKVKENMLNDINKEITRLHGLIYNSNSQRQPLDKKLFNYEYLVKMRYEYNLDSMLNDPVYPGSLFDMIMVLKEKVANNLNRTLILKKEIDKMSATTVERLNSYEKSLSDFFQFENDILTCATGLFNIETVKKFGFSIVNEKKEVSLPTKIIVSEIKKLLSGHPRIVDLIIEALAKSKETIIDNRYDKDSLRDFRAYQMYNNISTKEEITDLKRKIEDILKRSESLISGGSEE